MDTTKQPEEFQGTITGRSVGVPHNIANTASEMVPDTPDPPPAEDDVHVEFRKGLLQKGDILKWGDGPYSESLNRIADSMDRAVTLLEEIHTAIQPQEEADEVLDPDAGLVMLQATTPDGVARSYVVRTGSTKAAWEAACSAWDCEWADLVQKSVEMEE